MVYTQLFTFSVWDKSKLPKSRPQPVGGGGRGRIINLLPQRGLMWGCCAQIRCRHCCGLQLCCAQHRHYLAPSRDIVLQNSLLPTQKSEAAGIKFCFLLPQRGLRWGCRAETICRSGCGLQLCSVRHRHSSSAFRDIVPHKHAACIFKHAACI
jgi:hypothetical protein